MFVWHRGVPPRCSTDLRWSPICGILLSSTLSSPRTCIAALSWSRLPDPCISNQGKEMESCCSLQLRWQLAQICQVGNATYLSVRPDHPWYPALMRFSTVADLRVSLLKEIRKILTPLSLISWKNLSAWSRAGALLCFIHASNEVALSFSPLVLFPFHNRYSISDWRKVNHLIYASRHSLAVVCSIIFFDWTSSCGSSFN